MHKVAPEVVANAASLEEDLKKDLNNAKVSHKKKVRPMYYILY